MGGAGAQWVALIIGKVRSLVLSGPGSGKYSDKLNYPGVPLSALEMIEKGYQNTNTTTGVPDSCLRINS
jgi:hypothetical protein